MYVIGGLRVMILHVLFGSREIREHILTQENIENERIAEIAKIRERELEFEKEKMRQQERMKELELEKLRLEKER